MKITQVIILSTLIFVNYVHAHGDAVKTHEEWMNEDGAPMGKIKPIQKHNNHASEKQEQTHEDWMNEDGAPMGKIKSAKKHNHKADKQEHTHEEWMVEDDMGN